MLVGLGQVILPLAQLYAQQHRHEAAVEAPKKPHEDGPES